MFKSSEIDYKAQRKCQIEFKATEYEGNYIDKIKKTEQITECDYKFQKKFNVADYDYNVENKFKITKCDYKFKRDFHVAEYDFNENKSKDTEFEIENYSIKNTGETIGTNCNIEFKIEKCT